MKRVIALVLSLLVAAPVYADNVGIENTGASVLYGTRMSGPLSMNTQGQLMCSLNAGTASASNPIILEDSAFPDLQALMAVGVRLQSALSVDAAANDAGSLKAGLDGRLITAYAPAGETFAQCSSVETGTAARAIKNGVASNRHYVSSLSCYNTSAVASTIIFQDGSTTFYGGGLPSNVTGGIGSLVLQFPVPLRFGSGNPINFQLGTTATSTICCVAGYISVN